MMRLVLILVQVPAALMVMYLDMLSAAAVFRRRAPRVVPPRHRFAILVPAHNEEVLLPRLLGSLRALEYPRALFDIHVVADQCTDRTADIAAAAGATVHERREAEGHGKGYALRWLLDRLRERGDTYDAYIVFDADSLVSPRFLSVMNAYLARGAQV